MKKILFTIAIVLTVGFTASAQRGSDGFFGYNDFDNNDRISSVGMPAMPKSDIGTPDNQDAPLGTGMLVLTALGGAYAMARKRH